MRKHSHKSKQDAITVNSLDEPRSKLEYDENQDLMINTNSLTHDAKHHILYASPSQTISISYFAILIMLPESFKDIPYFLSINEHTKKS